MDEVKRITKMTPNSHFWLPIEWSMLLLKKAKVRGQIDESGCGAIANVRDVYDNSVYGNPFQHIFQYRDKLHQILLYDLVNVPLVHVQVSLILDIS